MSYVIIALARDYYPIFRYWKSLSLIEARGFEVFNRACRVARLRVSRRACDDKLHVKITDQATRLRYLLTNIEKNSLLIALYSYTSAQLKPLFFSPFFGENWITPTFFITEKKKNFKFKFKCLIFHLLKPFLYFTDYPSAKHCTLTWERFFYFWTRAFFFTFTVFLSWFNVAFKLKYIIQIHHIPS